MVHLKTSIISNDSISDCFYKMDFLWDDKSIPLPAQFCTIRVSNSSTPLLRRPFAFASYNPNTKTASIIYKKIGPATQILSSKKKNEELDVIGPLGNSFIEFLPNQPSKIILIAGGTGIGPIFFFGQYLKQINLTPIVITGYRTKSNIPTIDFSLNPVICTDDGTEGISQTPIDYLENFIKEQTNNLILFCCGPKPLLFACHNWAQKKGINCFAAFEQTMACGVGACMGCVIKIKDKEESYARVCKEGPVFDTRRIIWI